MKIILLGGLLILLYFGPASGSTTAGNALIRDSKHYSNVFGEIRNYRIFLPPAYENNPGKRYPVIYYYHGWSQRYFGSINDFKGDEGDSNGGDNIANFVAKHEVIVVKPDGYNRNILEEYYLRPYNIGPVETHRQFPLYFPELVSHIDATYRTIADREHRAISGLSMGGFMTFWIAGKYPHLISAAGNFCGSTEFIVGPKELQVEYRHQDLYKNYEGVNVRLNYGDKDFIRAYHKDMNKIWTQVLDNYEYKVYDAAHSTCGLGEMFSFLMKSFENPPAKPARWHHTDVYPSFSVWDYEVSSDRDIPGFTILEKVDVRGFNCSVRSFLPTGELLPFVKLTITTPPVYKKNQVYQIHDSNLVNGQSDIYSLKSNNEGRLKIIMDGNIHEIGINKAEDSPNLVAVSFNIENRPWATPGQEVILSVKLLNKGIGKAAQITARLESTRPGTTILKAESDYGSIATGELKNAKIPFTIIVKDNDAEIERFRLIIYDENGMEWHDFIDVPLKADGPEIKDFIIADGKEFAVAEAGDDTISVFLGKGNGDGKANPGESLVILVNDKGRLFRTSLFSNDPFVNPAGIRVRKSDSWTTYDHVGASAKYSVPILASDCPQKHRIKFFAEYWLPDYPDHIIKRGVIEINVEGRDQTAPEVEWVKISGDNTIHVKILDGGKISSVKAQLRLQKNPSKSFEIELNNDGKSGNQVPGDLVFSRKIEEIGFGLYQVVLEAEDIYGNKTKKEWPEIMVVH